MERSLQDATTDDGVKEECHHGQKKIRVFVLDDRSNSFFKEDMGAVSSHIRHIITCHSVYVCPSSLIMEDRTFAVRPTIRLGTGQLQW
jgi:hypothetical protein